jgi:hypothetical protein
LAAALITTTIKAIIAAAAVCLIVAGVCWFVMAVAGVAVPVIMVGALTIGVGFAANYVIEAADKFIGRTVAHDPLNIDGTATLVGNWIRKAGNLIQDDWYYLMSKMPKDFKEINF